MARCETCGNDYYDAFEVLMRGKLHTFDCFECAIQLLAPACAHCGCSIIGHGVERDKIFYCCDHCARHRNAPPSGGQENLATGVVST
jgi:hypothetical protein